MLPFIRSPRGQVVLLTCACAGVTVMLYAVDPNRTQVYPTCFLYQRTGIYCAGCGATRAAFALVHGRILEALHDNLVLTLAAPFILWQGGQYLARVWREQKWPEIWLSGREVWRYVGLGLGILFLFMALRNLPYAPFTLLAPIPPSIHFPGVRP